MVGVLEASELRMQVGSNGPELHGGHGSENTEEHRGDKMNPNVNARRM